MTIAIGASETTVFPQDRLSGTPRVHLIDRWIYVFTAASFVAIVLAGFVPDSLAKVAAVQAGARAPFPLILHIHAVLMGSFVFLLLAQTVLVAMGKCAWHKQLGIAAAILVPAIVIAGIVLVPTMYHQVWQAAQTAPAPVKPQLQALLGIFDNILLLQLRAGLLFSILMLVALRSRVSAPGVHKRLIFLATAPLLAAAVDRILWLPTTMPHSPLGADAYVLLVMAPMFLWDLSRNRGLHRAYLIWAAFFLPLSAMVYGFWDTPSWHVMAHHILGV
jgi:hypothetical protein